MQKNDESSTLMVRGNSLIYEVANQSEFANRALALVKNVSAR